MTAVIGYLRFFFRLASAAFLLDRRLIRSSLEIDFGGFNRPIRDCIGDLKQSFPGTICISCAIPTIAASRCAFDSSFMLSNFLYSSS